ncbi:hypothetical protein AQS8620_01456 [Aquimixticola soesokkakensis]|uniref:Uncharacterized protein n=1 Tax=Aquimixticola soesokkakensis TaxID=1519096 RepID=A0A1Y5SDX7_9RHOB|nr:hypothetical protein [Aquimixticola soesokkakensis]SLN38494.1 hypothetical protein AQS8620_01456 [Aquimixticola soesokkakensis]
MRTAFTIIFLALIFSLPNSAASADETGLSPQGKSIIERHLKKYVRDPSSLVITRLWIEDADLVPLMACGAFNAKNAFGGYSGETMFQTMYDADSGELTDTIIEDDVNTARSIALSCQAFGLTEDDFKRIDLE